MHNPKIILTLELLLMNIMRNMLKNLRFEYFFAKKITFSKQRAMSNFVVRLSLASIALAVATMEISVSVVEGFESAIQEKVFGFFSHVQLGNYFREIDILEQPLEKDSSLLYKLNELPNVEKISPFVVSEGLSRSDSANLGVVVRGVDSSYNWNFFRKILKRGKIPDLNSPRESLEVIISQKQANILEVDTGALIRVYFLKNSVPKQRRVKVVGIYESGMEEFDNYFIISDIRMLQRVQGLEEDQVVGFEIHLKEVEEQCQLTFQASFPFLVYECTDPILTAADTLNVETPYQYGAEPIPYLFPEIFDWLKLTYQNVWFILLLMMIVAIINMSSVVLILIIERTQTIGILKSLGLAAYRIRRLFVMNAFLLILVGVLVGNLLGLGVLYTQYEWGWLKLNQESYFINQVPVAWVWGRFLLVNLGVILICTAFMFIPTTIIARISPVSAIRFDK